MHGSLEFMRRCLSDDSEFVLVALPLNAAPSRTFYQFTRQGAWLRSAAGDMLDIQPFPGLPQASPVETDGREHYLTITEQAVAAIGAKTFDKVVLARTKTVDNFTKQSLPDFYERLVRRYPEALVFVVSTTENGIWVGATPELLVEKHGSQFHTIALAATSALPEPHWTPKAYDEHEQVVSYLRHVLESAGMTDIALSGPAPARYGKLTHLKTDMFFSSDLGVQDVVSLLHPTPALCGYPKEEALRFIQDHEGFPRELYTGCMVIQHSNGDGVAFAFLRCGKLLDGDRLRLYAGCGIVRGSTPRQEWGESEAKIDSLLREL